MDDQEKKIQQAVEEGRLTEGTDARIYKSIFDALSKSKESDLPVDFADRIIVKIERKEKRSSLWENVLIGLGFFLLFIGAVLAILFTGFTPNFGFLNGISEYKGLFFFGFIFILLLNWVDKKIVRRKQETS